MLLVVLLREFMDKLRESSFGHVMADALARPDDVDGVILVNPAKAWVFVDDVDLSPVRVHDIPVIRLG